MGSPVPAVVRYGWIMNATTLCRWSKAVATKTAISSCFARGLTNTASSVAVTLRKREKKPKKERASDKIGEPTAECNPVRALTNQ